MNASDLKLPFIHWDIEQGSSEWFELKAGMWSSSKANVIMGDDKTKGLDALIMDLAWGRVYGAPDGGYSNDAMKRGSEMEHPARDWYSTERMLPVMTAGLVMHATVPNVVWSPDGLVLLPEFGKRIVGAPEIKCPLHKAWMDCRKSGKVPSEYRWQTKWAMWVGQLEWLDFVMYHPRAGGIVIRCEPDPKDWELMEARVRELEPRVAEWVEVLLN